MTSSRRLILGLGLLTIPGISSAAVGNLRVLDSTPTQIILGFNKASSGPATIEVSESSTYSPVIYDVDSAKFSGSHQDTSRTSCLISGLDVICTIGKRTVEVGVNGKAYSRAGRADTIHYIRVTGPDSSTATTTGKTRPPIAAGNVPRDPFPIDPANPGRVLWPSLEYNDRTIDRIEPKTGATLKSWGLPKDVAAKFGDSALSACFQGTNWTLGSPCGAIGAAGSTYPSTSQDWLALGFPSLSADSSGGWRNDFLADRWGTNPMVPRWLKLTADLWFTGADLAAGDRVVDVCWGRSDLGCDSPIATVTAGTTQTTVVICNGSGTATCTDGEFWGGTLPNATSKRWGAGKIYNSGSSTTVNFRDVNDCLRLKPNMSVFVNPTTGVGVVQIVPSSLNCGGTPPSMTVGGAIDLTPPSPGPTLGWPFQHQNSLARNTAFSFLVRKHSVTANNTLHIANSKYGIGAGGMAAGSSTGEFEVCSGESKLSAAGFMHCMDAIGRTYALHPTTGEVRYLGTPVADTSGVGRAAFGTLPMLWETANTWWGSAPAPGGGASIFKATLATAAQNDDASAYISVDGGNEGWYDAAITNMLGSNKIGDLIQAAFPSFDKTLFSCSVTSYNVNRYILGACRLGNQDTYSWAWVYDLGNKLPLGAGGNGAMIAAFPTFSSATKIAWGTLHASHVTLDTSWAAMQNTVNKEDTPGNQKLYSTFDAWWTGSAWSATTLPNNASVRIRLTSAWNGAWGSTPGSFQSGDPVSSTQSPHWLQKLGIGNQLFVNQGAEHLEITAINGQDASGLDVTVTRRACLASGDTFQSVTVGMQLNANLRCETLDWWWDFLSGPTGADSSIRKLSLPGGGHQTDSRYYNIGTPEVGWHACDVETDASCFPMDATNRTQIIQRSDPPFAGKLAPIFGSCHEGHPGFCPEPGGGLQRIVDIHPLVCGYTTYTMAWVSGDLYKFTAPVGYPLERKHWSTMFSMGAEYTGRDISGPSSVIGDAASNAYDFCRADVAAGECVGGSAVGDLYVNYPGFGARRTCQDSVLTPDDPCVENMPGQAMAVGAYVLTGLNDKSNNIRLWKGREWISLIQTVDMFGGKGMANTANVKMFSLNWGWFGRYLVKIPRPPALDNANRSTFSPINLRLGSVPPGTNNVVAEFGYDDLNTSSLAFPPCATRQETCVAASATINEAVPFSWASEAPAGIACTSACNVVIPGLSGRVLTYRLKYRNAANAVILTGRTEVVAVP